MSADALRRRECGAATIWVLSVATLLLVVAAVAALRAAAVLARHRAEAAADLAALAGASVLGTAEPPCTAARRIADRNGGSLARCRVRVDAAGRSGVVDVVVALPVRLPVLGGAVVRASARAGRRPAGDAGAAGAAGADSAAGGLGHPAVWHAGPRRPYGDAPPLNLRGNGEQEGERVEVSVSRNAAEDVPVVAVSGEVDVYSAPELKESLTKLLQSGATSVVVDLSDVAFLDSTGLGALVEARAATSEAGGSLPIVCSHERILKLFTITGLDGVFSIHPSVDEALAALQG